MENYNLWYNLWYTVMLTHFHQRWIFFWTQFYLCKLTYSLASNIQTWRWHSWLHKTLEPTGSAFFFREKTWQAHIVTTWKTFLGNNNLFELWMLRWNDYFHRAFNYDPILWKFSLNSTIPQNKPQINSLLVDQNALQISIADLQIWMGKLYIKDIYLIWNTKCYSVWSCHLLHRCI